MAELPGARVLIEADLETFETNERQEKPTRIRENDNKIKQESSLIEQEVNEYQEEQDDSGDYEEEGGERHGEEHIEEYEEDFEEQDELEDDHDIPEPSRPKRPKALAIKAQRGNVRFNELSQYRLRKEREAWSLEEIRALEAGLKKYKAPCWVDIKNYVSPDLDSRTNIQIKDKAHGEIKRRRREEQDLGPYKYVRLRK
ncbi:hypothetical protein G6F56_012845 [Rhizopus delemar]|nr:hypothetical protein G6F56_012845 [Rhizopus delemar]